MTGSRALPVNAPGQLGEGDLLQRGFAGVGLGLILILRSSYRAKRSFIRAQHARPRWVYPFRRLLRRNPEFGQVFWQQALRAEKMVEKNVLRRRRRPLIRLRKKMRRMWRRAFG